MLNKIVKWIYDAIAWIPMLWSVMCLVLLFIAYSKLGHFPQYGIDPDPAAMGYDCYEYISTWVLIIAFASSFIWLFTIIAFISTNKAYRVNRYSLIAFVLGIIFFLGLKYQFSPQFLWFND